MNDGIVNGLFPFFSSNTMALAAYPDRVAGILQERSQEFLSVLDLVSDLQMIEEQLGSLQGGRLSAEFFEKESAAYFDKERFFLEKEKTEARFSIATLPDALLQAQNSNKHSHLIGHQKNAGEIKADLQAAGLSPLDVMSGRLIGGNIPVMPFSRTGLSIEAVDQWSQAFVKDDILDVQVNIKQSLGPRINEQLTGIVTRAGSPAVDSSQWMALSQTREAFQPLTKVVTNVLPFDVKNDRSLNSQHENMTQQEEMDLRADQANDFVKNLKVSKLSKSEKVEVEDKNLVRSQMANKADDSLKSYADFALEASLPSVIEPRASEQPVLVHQNVIGSESDIRVPKEAVNLIADKAKALSEKGGGTLRVKLNPDQLGRVDIEVTSVQGQMRVVLRAEKSDTQKLLGKCSDQLLSRLSERVDNLTEVKLQIVDMGSRNALAAKQISSSSEQFLGQRQFLDIAANLTSSGNEGKVSGNVLASHEFLSHRIEGADSQIQTRLESNFSRFEGGESPGGNAQREHAREQPNRERHMRQWEELIEQRLGA